MMRNTALPKKWSIDYQNWLQLSVKLNFCPVKQIRHIWTTDCNIWNIWNLKLRKYNALSQLQKTYSLTATCPSVSWCFRLEWPASASEFRYAVPSLRSFFVRVSSPWRGVPSPFGQCRNRENRFPLHCCHCSSKGWAPSELGSLARAEQVYSDVAKTQVMNLHIHKQSIESTTCICFICISQN